jgi:hypothetical protein
LSGEHFFDQTLVMPPGATAIDPGIRRHGMVEVFVPEKLPHNFKSTGLIIEKNFCAQMTILVWCQVYARPLLA